MYICIWSLKFSIFYSIPHTVMYKLEGLKDEFYAGHTVRRIIWSCFIGWLRLTGWFFWVWRLVLDQWVSSSAVCRLPVRNLSLLTAYATRHTFGCVLHVSNMYNFRISFPFVPACLPVAKHESMHWLSQCVWEAANSNSCSWNKSGILLVKVVCKP